MATCIEEYEYKLKSDDEYKNIVKSTIFNILMGKDSNGCLIDFSNDIDSSIIDTKDYNVNNLDELLELSVKKMKDYMELFSRNFLIFQVKNCIMEIIYINMMVIILMNIMNYYIILQDIMHIK